MRKRLPALHAPDPDKPSWTLCGCHRRDAVHMAATREAVTCRRCLRWEDDLAIAYAEKPQEHR